jgi:hypothetical protein
MLSKAVLGGLALLVCAGAALQAQSVPPAFPREGAVKLIENDRVVVWDVTATEGDPAATHEHPLDTVVVALSDGSVTFERRGTVHPEDAPGGRGHPRIVAVELKGSSPSGSAPAPGYPPSFPRKGARQLLDNQRVSVWEVAWPQNEPTAMHTHPFPTVSVTISGGRQRETRLDGTSSERDVPAGEVRYSDAGRVHQEEGTSQDPRRAIILELK